MLNPCITNVHIESEQFLKLRKLRQEAKRIVISRILSPIKHDLDYIFARLVPFNFRADLPQLGSRKLLLFCVCGLFRVGRWNELRGAEDQSNKHPERDTLRSNPIHLIFLVRSATLEVAERVAHHGWGWLSDFLKRSFVHHLFREETLQRGKRREDGMATEPAKVKGKRHWPRIACGRSQRLDYQKSCFFTVSLYVAPVLRTSK